ncbi:methyl-accepting chemotaxis protein [Bacillus sp. Bva_UNVM-123]|uniref:methyl-accepting chemotaxis protein n=1 Tax=Bacillus sp. Bva_UNVM-123 TaxID=2829798 RepID=UPI00391F503B
MVDSLRGMANKMDHLIHEAEIDSKILNDQANISSHVSETVSSAMSEVASGSEQLAANMVNISTHVESNNSAVISMSERINTIVKHAQETRSITSEGQIAMTNMNNKMTRIVSQSIESTSIMKELDRKLQAINDITTLIHDISEQTNLLSLNASIEAARAGEQGRGFAVVAQEVKKLAEQSSASVDKIASLISEIQDDSTRALKNIDLGRLSAEEGAEMVNHTAMSYKNMFGFIKNLAKDIDEIAAASDTLSDSSQSISHSVDSVVAISQQTSAGVEEVTSITEEQQQSVQQVKQISTNIRRLTENLREIIKHFKV